MTDVAQLLTAVFVMLTTILGFIAWVAMRQSKAQKPNGGKSMYDLLLRIEKRIDRLEQQADDHLQHHLKG